MLDDMITSDPRVMLGKPVIAGARIPVEFVLEQLADGRTISRLLDDYPSELARSPRPSA